MTEKRKKEKKKEKNVIIVATNVVASQPTERRPNGTPHARAKILLEASVLIY